MRGRRLSVSEVLNGQKMQKSVKRMRSKDRIPRYYVMGEDHKITVAHFGFCLNMHKMGEYLKAPFPDGEIFHQIEDNARFWFSTSRESLIAVMENRKEPWVCLDLREDNK
ncbi:hypothetical protein CLV62_12558 [Dysgonomonas alginatilytica]|uniref:Uncharacterized protein n=1 Tax=Dysgonomonas alginatilytica TaxID=1605892 RepID=A0A2V3PK87_9BACT|nr:hypothetical protein [Dysgonomonas alginatilytica]PXV61225.1 hypothetical protein CLV62_12558 [Dysgonomonas alginatilytica]